jgi:hypothetical protein
MNPGKRAEPTDKERAEPTDEEHAAASNIQARYRGGMARGFKNLGGAMDVMHDAIDIADSAMQDTDADAEEAHFSIIHKNRHMNDEEKEEEGEEENPVEEFILLVVYTTVTYGYLGLLAQELQAVEHWESFHDAFYFVFITSTTIGFGDFAPEVSKQWISTHAHILLSLTLMAMWLGSAGEHFFKYATPWKYVKWLLSKYVPSLMNPKSSNNIVKKGAMCVLGSPVLQSWSALVVSMVLAALVLQALEYDLAQDQSKEYHLALNEIIEEFKGDELANASSVVAIGDLSADVEAALELLNSMGTCGGPPSDDEDIDFSFRASMIYAFYISSTIGCKFGNRCPHSLF